MGTISGRLMLLLVLVACHSIDADTGGMLTLDTIGDTIVAYSSGAGAWGEGEMALEEELRIGALEGEEEYTFGQIHALAPAADGGLYVLDGQALLIRQYDAAGRHVRSFGGSGAGPGELKQPTALVVLRDGRVAVADPANARINVYSAEGESVATWQVPGGFITSNEQLQTDTAGNVYFAIIVERLERGGWVTGLLRLDESGAVLDTVVRPFAGYQGATLQAQRVTRQGSAMSMAGVPFMPAAQTAWSPLGMFVGGISDRYAIDAFRADSTVFRITRDYQPVPVQAGERAVEVERVTRMLRNTDPDWKWSGPQPPDHKPAFRSLRVDLDGRIWVRISAEATKLPPDPDAQPDPRGLPPPERWVEPSLYDVFQSDGHYLGRVRLPDRFSMFFARGERVCGVLRDEVEVQYVSCGRIVGD